MKRLLIVILACALAVPLAGCGKKDDPVPPDGKESEFPRQYPR